MICALIGLAVAMPAVSPGDDAHAEVLSRTDDVRADGFNSELKTSNGIEQTASGDEHGTIHGSFSWTSPEGLPVNLNYVADENGYQPQSDVLPTSPPIPEAIARALEWIAAHPSTNEEQH
ncbi:larval cuticle protein 2 [Drosophila grimshawi]|nr:larval cuticle protein 2 [Drosophila grimshawi]